MKILVALKYKLSLAFALIIVAPGFAQEKFVESYDAGDDMVVTVKTSHTSVIFETWNKNKVEVAAFIEGDALSKEQKQALFDDWNFEVLGNSKNVVISSNAIGSWNGNSLSSLEAQMGEDFGTALDVSAEKFGEDNEIQPEALGKIIERSVKIANGISYSKTTVIDENGIVKTIITTNKVKRIPAAKRTIIIKMPKRTKTDINVRYGEIKMADAFNVKAVLNHTPFTAERIDGAQTLINASYAPVVVKDWQYGTLYVKFVDTCDVEAAASIHLNANSSNVRLGSVVREAFVTGSFGTLIIDSVASDFKQLEIVLRNTDASVSLPNNSFSFLFNGKKSSLQHPKLLQISTSNEGKRLIARGFYKNATQSRNVLVNADYSTLILK